MDTVTGTKNGRFVFMIFPGIFYRLLWQGTKIDFLEIRALKVSQCF